MKDEKAKQQSMQIQIKAEEATQAGLYSNFARIAHSPEEFTFDFIFVQQNPPYGKLQSRIIVTPSHAKRFLAALEENVKKYESAHGEIRIPSASVGNIDLMN